MKSQQIHAEKDTGSARFSENLRTVDSDNQIYGENMMNAGKNNGEPLPDFTSQLMSRTLGTDMGDVKIHTDTSAIQMNRQLGARAFTFGSDIYFNSGEYNPDTSEGKHLLAHELTHTIQQSSNLQPLIQRTCQTPPSRFDFGSSDFGQSLNQALDAGVYPNPLYREEESPPPEEEEQDAEMSEETRQLLANLRENRQYFHYLDPESTINLLSQSNCFLFLASEMQRLYYGRRPSRSPELQFLIHSDDTTGSHFDRATSTIVVQADTARQSLSIRRLVHELVHAYHSGPVAAQETDEIGSVTQVERARITEESETRTLENEILSEIQDSPAAAEAGLRPSRETETEEEQVRDSFRSGRPRLTYQEYFIIEEMKNRTSIEGFDEDAAITSAHQMIETGLVDFEPAASFEIIPAEIQQYTRPEEGEAETPLIVPNLDEALACVDLYWASTRRERLTVGFGQDLDEISLGCVDFIVRYYSRFGIDRQDPRGNELEHRIYLHSLLTQMDADYNLQRGLRTMSRAFTGWFNSVPEDHREEAIDLFEWILIQERMSIEWLEMDDSSPDRTIRINHLQYLQNRIGADLVGISEP